MKALPLFFVALLLLVSCEYQDNGITSINEEITSQYLIDGLIAGDLDLYMQDNQIFRYKGKPGTETVLIGDKDFTIYEPCFVLHFSTGTTPETIVSSAIVKLDEMEILNTSDFSKNAGEYTFEVCNIISSSTISVEVRGEPSSYILIWIEGRLKNTVTDIDGNIYKTVQIGEQVWMKENLRVTKYRDGLPVPYVPGELEWGILTTPGFCWLESVDPLATKEIYGALYNWYAVSTEKLCPSGWHVPTNEEWTTLTNYYGGFVFAGGALKEEGTEHWYDPNVGATNISGFSALPGSNRIFNGVFARPAGQLGFWWTSSFYTSPEGDGAWMRGIYNDNVSMDVYPYPLNEGLSVRCIKDN